MYCINTNIRGERTCEHAKAIGLVRPKNSKRRLGNHMNHIYTVHYVLLVGGLITHWRLLSCDRSLNITRGGSMLSIKCCFSHKMLFFSLKSPCPITKSGFLSSPLNNTNYKSCGICLVMSVLHCLFWSHRYDLIEDI